MNDPENQSVDAAQEELNCWAFIEIYGHHRVAGRISTRKFGPEVMFQVDVPKGATEFSRSELYGPKAIFSIKPTTEEWCRKFIANAEASHHEVLPYVPEERQIPASTEDRCPNCDKSYTYCDCPDNG